MHPSIEEQPEFKTLIYEGELERIAGWVEEYPDLETGGDLFGFWTHSGSPVIQFVLGPGEYSKHNEASFYQDKKFLIGAGELLREKHGLQHIGEWHSHHQLGLAQPSGGDQNTVLRALQRYEFPKFLLCITNLRPRSNTDWNRQWTVSIGAFLFTQFRTNYQVGAWVVLPGESPIRSSLRSNQNKIYFKEPRLSKSWNVRETKLDSQVLEPTTQPVEISPILWYAKPEGLELLRQIDTKLKQRFDNCIMLRNNQERIYFTFDEGKDKWRVEFPDNFPMSPPSIQVNLDTNIDVDNWESDSDVLNVIENHLHLQQGD